MNAVQINVRRWWLDCATPGDFLRVTLHLVGGDTPPRILAQMRSPYFADNGEVF